MKRNKFSLSHTKLLSCDGGELIPCGMFEVLPGDSVQQATSFLVRASALLSPVMHPVSVRVHHWFVPYRIIWDDFEKFITGGDDGMDATVYPTIASTSWAQGGLGDYLGLPTGVIIPAVSALPFRAYNMIFNEWYRDQDLDVRQVVNTGSGNDTTTSGDLCNICWEKDYFTSARPWAQKGPTVTIPLGTSAIVKTSAAENFTGVQQGLAIRRDDGSGVANGLSLSTNNPGSGARVNTGAVTASSGTNVYPTNLYADLSGASAVSITTFREALALQRYEEARARYGSRYPEYLAYLGVRSSDGRLQRPEYLGGGKQTISFSEVLQTGVTTSGNTAGVGNLRGHGIAAMRSNKYRRFFEEHGLVMSLLSIRPKTMYQQGISRMWNRRSKDDFWQKEFEAIGQQEILNKEIYGVHASPDGTFGYQDRYDEYRRMESSVAGDFRSTLDFWHMSRVFSSAPALNATFVTAVPTERTFAVPSEDVYYVHASHSIQARRLVAKTGRSFTF